MNDNLNIYNKVRSVPQSAMKTITAGRIKGMTDINPMWRIKTLTELFGPCGVGWWYEITEKYIEEDEWSKQSAAFVDILLFYVDPVSGEPSHGIPGTGGASFVAQEKNGPYLSDECFKMALTDAISVAAKALGIGADVYWNKDESKYKNSDMASDPKSVGDGIAGTPISNKCSKCNAEISEKVKEYSLKAFGAPLCMNCQRSAKTNGN